MTSKETIQYGEEEEYFIEYKVPTPKEHFTLRKLAGLTPPPVPANEESLKNTWFGVTIRNKQTQEAVSMGRIIGDGILWLVVVDMCTLPEHQRKGLGAKVMKALLEYVDKNASESFLTLFADPPGVKMYKRFGFIDNFGNTGMLRPNAKQASLLTQNK